MARSANTPSPEDIQFQRKLLQKLADAAKSYSRPKIPSQTLRNSAYTVVLNDNKTAYVEIPEYWAIYVHDGRGAFGPRRPGSVLVYFRNPKNDPRLAPTGKSPIRYSQTKRLTQPQFSYWLRQNQKARALGVPVPMIVRTDVGPMRGSFFFDNNRGMSGFKAFADQLAAPIATRHIQHQLQDYFTVKTEKVVIKIGV